MARSITHLVIHHSATPSGDVVRFREEHRKRGFADIGYHSVIGNGYGLPDGHIAAGRPESQDGAGVFGNNKFKLHVCVIGCFEPGAAGSTVQPTQKQYAALGHWLLKNAVEYRRKDGSFPQIVGHKEITIPGHATACPGRNCPLQKIRAWFKRNVELAAAGKPITMTLDQFLARNE